MSKVSTVACRKLWGLVNYQKNVLQAQWWAIHTEQKTHKWGNYFLLLREKNKRTQSNLLLKSYYNWILRTHFDFHKDINSLIINLRVITTVLINLQKNISQILERPHV